MARQNKLGRRCNFFAYTNSTSLKLWGVRGIVTFPVLQFQFLVSCEYTWVVAQLRTFTLARERERGSSRWYFLAHLSHRLRASHESSRFFSPFFSFRGKKVSSVDITLPLSFTSRASLDSSIFRL